MAIEIDMEFGLVGLLRIQSNPFVILANVDSNKWAGVDMLYEAKNSAILEGIKEESEVKIHEFPGFANKVIELDYFGNCLIYSAPSAIALVFSEPEEEISGVSFIPFEFVSFQTFHQIEVTPFNTWYLMDSLIDGNETSFNDSVEGISKILGIEGFDLFCSSFKFKKITYARSNDLKGILLTK